MKLDIAMTCVTAMSGKEALEIIKQDAEKLGFFESSFKLILMDYEMPEMTGPECTRTLRNYLYTKKIDQPVVIGVTSNTNQKQLNEALGEGMNSIFPKLPFPESFLRKLLVKCDI